MASIQSVGLEVDHQATLVSTTYLSSIEALNTELDQRTDRLMTRVDALCLKLGNNTTLESS